DWKVWMVELVEGLRPQTYAHTFPNLEGFRYRGVEVEKVWTDALIAGHRAAGIHIMEPGGGNVVTVCRCALNQVNASVLFVQAPRNRCRQGRNIASEEMEGKPVRRCEIPRPSGCGQSDAGNFPSADDRVEYSRGIAGDRLSLSERQFGQKVSVKLRGPVEVGQSVRKT